MPGVWGEQEAIAAGLYDAPGSQGATALKAATDKLRTGMSDLAGGGSGSGVTPPATASSSSWWDNLKIPKLSDVLTGMANGPGKNTVDGKIESAASDGVKLSLGPDLAKKISDVQGSFADWIPRLIVIGLGFIFVAVALAMFGFSTPVGQEVARTLRNNIPK